MNFFDGDSCPSLNLSVSVKAATPTSLHLALKYWSKNRQECLDFEEIEKHLKNGTSPHLNKEVITFLTQGPLRYSPGKLIGLLNLLFKYGLDINNPAQNGLSVFAENILSYKNTVLFRLLLEYGLSIRPLQVEKIEALIDTLSANAVTSLDHYILAILHYQYHPKWFLPIENALKKAVDSMYEYAYLRSVQLSLRAECFDNDIETYLEKALERIELIAQHADDLTMTPIYPLLIAILYELNQQVVHEKLGDLILRGIVLLNQQVTDHIWLSNDTKHRLEMLNSNPLPSLRQLDTIQCYSSSRA